MLPDTPQARCSNTATYLLHPTHPPPTTTRTMCGTNRSLCLRCHKMLLGCIRGPFTSLQSWFASDAWHYMAPCLLQGLGIYCNAIVLDGIGPVLTLMMPSSLNLESLLLSWRPYIWPCMGCTLLVFPCKDN